MNAPIWVARPAELRRMVKDLAHQPIIAVDTESNSLFAYREQVCLIQISTPDTDYLLDPLTLTDLSELAPIMADPQIEKVFHAGEYDVLCLKRDFDFKFANLFDTMLACRILGREAFGLGAILEAEFGVTLDKRYQRANWGQRPLPQAQLNYARMDSHFLVALRDRLRQELIATKRWALAQEDFQRLCDLPVHVNGDEQDNCWRLTRGQTISPQQAAVLHELCQYRDRQAQIADLPLFKVLSNDTLLQIAQSCPTDTTQMGGLKILTPRQFDRHAEGLCRAVERGLHQPPRHRPASTRPDDAYLERLESLRSWRKQTAQLQNVESDVVLPRDVMEEIAAADPATPEALAKIMAHLPWRLDHFGRSILLVLQGVRDEDSI